MPFKSAKLPDGRNLIHHKMGTPDGQPVSISQRGPA